MRAVVLYGGLVGLVLVPVVVGLASRRLERRPLVAALAVLAVAAVVGLHVHAGRVVDGNTAARHLTGSVLAGLGTGVWTSIWVTLGRTWSNLRSLPVVVVLLAVPAYVIALFLALYVSGLVDCAPGQYECPL